MQRMIRTLGVALLIGTSLLTLLVYSFAFAAQPLQESAQVESDGQEYLVQAGDWLSKISQEFLGNSSAYQSIVDATNTKAESDPRFSPITDPNVIQVGQRLWIPKSADEESVEISPTTVISDAMAGEGVGDGEIMTSGIRFVEPEAGAELQPAFNVEMAAEGLTIEPAGEIHAGAGHFHILVDTDFIEAGELVPFDANHLHFGMGQLTTTLELEPGVHTLRLQVANGAHIALEGKQYQDAITVTVSSSEAALPGIRFVEPEEGADVQPLFDVEMAAQGVTIEPAGEIHEGAGHFHILIDTDFIEAGELVPFDASHLHFGMGQLTTTLELEPGVHTLGLQVANGAHIALEGEQYQDAITVTVSNAEAVVPGIRFVAPEDGAEVQPAFGVEMAAVGVTIEPAGEIHEGAGHFHILVDTDFVAAGELVPFDASHLHFGMGQLTTTLQLEPGVHILRLQVANGAHIALEGEQFQDVITVTVSSAEAVVPEFTKAVGMP